MPDLIRLSKSVIGEEEKAAVASVMDDGYLGMGNEVRLFEEELSGFFGGREVACVSTGTAALHLGLAAIELQPGDEVLVQSLTFVGSFQAISATGAVPVPCEIEPATVTIDLADAASRITPRTKAIMPVHYASGVGPLDDIFAFAERHGLRVVEDAAHAFGTTYKERRIGTFGDVTCFSFDGIKNITSGEGGAVVSDDPGVMRRVRDDRLLGVVRDTEQRYVGKRSWEFDVFNQGYRYHMSNLFAAIGRVQLRRLPEFRERRIELANRYQQALSPRPELRLLDVDYGPVVPHIFPLRVLEGRRDGLRDFMAAQNIETGIHYQPSHLLSLYGARRGEFPVTEALYQELLTLPLHPDLTDQDQDRVLDAILRWVESDSDHRQTENAQ